MLISKDYIYSSVVLVLLVICIALGYLHHNTSKERANDANRIASLEKRLAELEDQKKYIQPSTAYTPSRAAETAAVASSAANSLEPEGSEGVAESNSPDEQKPPSIEEMREIYKLEQKIASGELEDIYKQLEDRYQAETVDSEWATDYSNNLQKLFAEDVTLSNYALQNIDCKQTQCKMTVYITDINQANSLVDSLDAALQDNEYDLAPLSAFNNPDIEKGVTHLYIMREEYGFNFE